MPKTPGAHPEHVYKILCQIASSYTSGPNGHRPQKGLTEVKFECGDAALPFFGVPRRGTAGPAPFEWRLVPGGSLWGSPLRRWNGRNRALPGGALFLWRNRGKNTKGKEVPSPWNPILWWEKRGRWLVRLEPGLRPPEPTPHGPPTGSDGREKWFVDGRKEWGNRKGFLSLLPKGTCPQPAQPVGGPLPAFQ